MTLRNTIFLLALGLVATGCRHAQPPPPDKPLSPPIAYKGRYYVLPTGMRLVVNEDPQAQEFMLVVSHAVGMRDEDPKKMGLAHLCEHMAFKGRQLGADQPRIWERLLASGVEMNAFTTEDNTDYWERGKPDQLNQMIALEAQRMKDPLANVTQADFEAERDVVISEFRERDQTNPEGAQVSWIKEAAFGDHVYGRNVAGNEETLRSITLDDVRAWFKEHYTPERTILVVSSPKTSLEVERWVAAMFGPLAKGKPGAPHVQPATRTPPPLPEAKAALAMVTRHLPVQRPELWLAWVVPGTFSQQMPKVEVATSEINIRMGVRFREDPRVISAGAFTYPLEGASLIVARLELSDEKAAPGVLETVNDQLTGFFTEQAFSASHTVTVRNELLAQNFLERQHFDGSQIAAYLRATGNPDYFGGVEKQIREQLTNDIGSFGAKYITRERTVSLLVTPDTKLAPAQQAKGKGDQFDEVKENAPFEITPERVLAVASHPGLDRVERRTLGNGLRVTIARRGSLPIADVRLVVRTHDAVAGDLPVLPRLALQTSWVTSRQNNGDFTGNIGGDAIREAEPGRVVFGGTVPSGNVDNVLADAAFWLDDTTPEVQPFDIITKRLVKQSEAAAKLPRNRALSALSAGVFPGHPYGRAAEPAMYGQVSRSDASAWLSRELSPENAELIIVGDVEPTPALWDQIDRRLGGWKAPSRERPADEPVHFRTGRKVVLIDRPEATQAEVFVAVAAPKLDQRDTAGLAALSWYAGQHLTNVLRVQQGVTYGVHPFQRHFPQAEMFAITTAVDNSAAARALSLTLAQLQELKDKPLPENQLALAKWTLARRYAMAFDQIDEAAENLQRLNLEGLPADYWETYPKTVAELSGPSLQATAGRFNIGSEMVVVIGDQRVLLPQLQQAGFAVEVDAAK